VSNKERKRVKIFTGNLQGGEVFLPSENDFENRANVNAYGPKKKKKQTKRDLVRRKRKSEEMVCTRVELEVEELQETRKSEQEESVIVQAMLE
jgi:hypothetical protein